jgi:hypothetical protein
MLFLWTITKRGKIWMDGDAFRQIVVKRLPEGYFCQEVSFVGDQNLLNVFITMPEPDDPQKRLDLMDKFEEFFRPTGITVHIHWTRKSSDEYGETDAIWKKPLFWALAAGGAVALANLGIEGAAWTAGATALGYIISWVALSEEGNRLFAKFISDIKDLRR